MSERTLIAQKAESFFDDLWKRGDPWKLETSDFERIKYEREIGILRGRHYSRVLEIGCGAGWFTRSLAQIADQIVALDISPAAIGRAQAAVGFESIDFRVANVMDYNPRAEGPWDLVVMNETIYYLGWLYSFFDVAWLAAELFAATRDEGQVLMANTCGGVEDYLLLNVGYQLDSEETFRGTKDGADIEVIISLFGKAPAEKDSPLARV